MRERPAPPTLVEEKSPRYDGGRIHPFEALRLGCDVIANESNPVASMILRPLKFPTSTDLEWTILNTGARSVEKVSTLRRDSPFAVARGGGRTS